MELTSHELLQSLRSVLQQESHKSALSQVFQLADLAKFAKEQPIASENEACMKHARQFVLETKPQTEE